MTKDKKGSCLPRLSNKKVSFRELPLGSQVGIVAVASVDLTLRIVAISRALKRGDKGWVLPLALVSSAGILPCIYLAKHPVP